jgi:hypothetical protein
MVANENNFRASLRGVSVPRVTFFIHDAIAGAWAHKKLIFEHRKKSEIIKI